MPTPITCPKPIPGMCDVYLQDWSMCYTFNRNKNLNIFGVENDPFSQRMSKSSFVFPLSPALTGSTFRPMRAMINCTTSYWRQSRRRVASQWNESHLVECLCVWTSVTVQDYSDYFRHCDAPTGSLGAWCACLAYSLPLLSPPRSTLFPYRCVLTAAIESSLCHRQHLRKFPPDI